MSNPAAPAATYRQLLAQPDLGRFLASLALLRLGGNMYSLAIVLFALERFRSPALAGLVLFASFAPGLVLGPLAGALLDRHGRVRLIALDMGVAAAMIVAIVALALAGRLSAPVLLVVVTLGAVTVPLTIGGVRSLLPLLLPRLLWDRGNALDSSLSSVVTVAGPALAGVLYAIVGGLTTLTVIGVCWLAAGLLILTVREPRIGPEGKGRLLDEAWAGVRRLFGNRTLRGLTFTLPVASAADGVLIITLPVLVLHWPGGGPAQVGALWAAQGLAATASGLVFGRVPTEGRERTIMAVALAVAAIGAGLLAAAPGLRAAAIAVVLIGATAGPFDIAFFSLRQRVTEPAWLGRILTVSASVNSLGQPIGSAGAGPLVALVPAGGAVAAAGLWVASAVLCLVAVPASRRQV